MRPSKSISGARRLYWALTPCDIARYGEIPEVFRGASGTRSGPARRAYRLFLEDPGHPSLRMKHVHSSKPIVSVRVGIGYRALGVRSEETIVRFWIGSHADYVRLVR